MIRMCTYVVVVACIVSAQAAEDLVLVDSGRPNATIVVAAEPSEQAVRAAGELQAFIERMSGARLAIRREPEEVAGNRIFVGMGAGVQRLGVDVPAGFTNAMNEEGYVIRRVGTDLVLAGNEHGMYKGTLFAVYDLLGRLGCRWYFPGPFGEVVPRRDTIAAGEVSVVERPDFRFRNIWYSGWMPVTQQDGERFAQWMERNRMTSLHGLSLPGDGSIVRLAPAEQYFETHPHIFAVNEKGERVKDMLCLSEPDAVTVAVQTISQTFRDDPRQITFGFAPPDGHPRCYCDRCKAAVPGFGGKGYGEPSLSDIWFAFANRVASEVYKEFPERWLFTNGYANRVMPPEGVGPLSPNLGIQSAMLDTCTLHPIGHRACWQRMAYKTVLDRWTRELRCVFIYDYDPGKSLDNLPFPMLHNLGPDFRYFKERGVWGFWTEGQNTWLCTHLNYYARAQLMWDADTDLEAVVRDYCRTFYGESGAAIEDYIWTLERAVAETDVHTTWGRLVPWQVILPPHEVERLDRLIRRAQKLAESEPYRERVRVFSLAHDHMTAFLNMEAAAANGDFREAVGYADRMKQLRDETAKVDPALLPHTPDWCKDHRGSLEWYRDVYQRLSDRTAGPSGRLVAMLPRMWEFKTDPRDAGVIEQWYLPEAGHEWEPIDSALYWDVQGYQDRTGRPYAGKAWYRNSVAIPASVEGKPLRLTIGGVYNNGVWIWVNGRLVHHRPRHDSGSPFDVDVTGIAAPGAVNSVAIRVDTIAADRMPRGGLHRRVFVWTPTEAEP